MKRISRWIHRSHSMLLGLGMMALLAHVLVACGGSTTVAGGVGSGGTGVAEGTVSGFGSVIVEGVEFDDSHATAVSGNQFGQSDATEVKLGQRVRIRHSQAGVADAIEVLPQLRGAASSDSDAQGMFALLGQSVRIVTSSDTQNTATVLEGLTTVKTNDELEVHGSWVYDTLLNRTILVASRIEKLSVTADPILFSGLVKSVSGTTLTMSNASGQKIQSSVLPASITSDSLISAWISRAALSDPTWVATRVVDASASVAGGERLVLGTQVTAIDLTANQIRVQGLLVNLPSDIKNPLPSLGAMVQLELVKDGSGYKAVSVKERQNSNDLGGAVELKGSLSWPADTSLLTLRSTAVTVSAGALSSSCRNLQVNDMVYLEITAQRMKPGDPLKAMSVACNLKIPDNSVMQIDGQLMQLDTVNKTLVVRTSQGMLTLMWDNSALLPLQLNTLLNQKVQIDYQVINAFNRIRKLKPS